MFIEERLTRRRAQDSKMKEKKNIRFIRKNGRIIPIKSKKGGSGAKKSSRRNSSKPTVMSRAKEASTRKSGYIFSGLGGLAVGAGIGASGIGELGARRGFFRAGTRLRKAGMGLAALGAASAVVGAYKESSANKADIDRSGFKKNFGKRLKSALLSTGLLYGGGALGAVGSVRGAMALGRAGKAARARTAARYAKRGTKVRNVFPTKQLGGRISKKKGF